MTGKGPGRLHLANTTAEFDFKYDALGSTRRANATGKDSSKNAHRASNEPRTNGQESQPLKPIRTKLLSRKLFENVNSLFANESEVGLAT
jgi:hypothetical protein